MQNHELTDLLLQLRRNRPFMEQVVAWERIPARGAAAEAMPDTVDGRFVAALAQQGITELYTHQVAALTAVSDHQPPTTDDGMNDGKRPFSPHHLTLPNGD
ncbi:MAG: hypothetical protein KDE56_15075 [Anaerolineales bacterium]|nr:hypothetical protein [Anaerolineales bacterium]